MSNVGNTRKLFLDSRFKISGADSDFTLELPQDVQCTRTSSFFVASCSFANTFGTITPANNKFWYLSNSYAGTVYTLNVATIPSGDYDPVALSAAIVQAVPDLRYDGGKITWDPLTGTYTIDFHASPAGQVSYCIPGYGTDIDQFVKLYAPQTDWAFIVRDLATNQEIPYIPGDKTSSVNGLLNMPSVFGQSNPYKMQPFQTGIVDLAAVREIYVHSSLANNSTLHVNGSRDCICRVPIDVAFGDVAQYRYLGPTDAISCSDQHFRTISFQLRDFAGRLVPEPFSFVVIELAFLDTDPYAM